MKLEYGTTREINSIDISNERPPKDYPSGSMIGGDCERQVYFAFRHPKKIDDLRVYRIFELGNLLEDHVVEILRKKFTVHSVGENGSQFSFKDDENKITGSIDGVICGLPESNKPHLLEIKTYNQKRYDKLLKEGVKESDPKYYVQMQIYMNEFKLEKALFVAYNKNTSEIYTERVDYSDMTALKFLNRSKKVYAATSHKDLDRVSEKVTDFKCKFCQWKKECFSE